MSTLYVEGSTSLKRALIYLSEPSHNPTKVPQRNLLVYTNCDDPTGFMIATQWRISQSQVKNQIYSIRLSFSRGEFDPSNHIDQYQALDVTRTFTEEWLKSKNIMRPYLIALQADGQSGLLHSHIYICNPGDNGEGISKGVSALQMQDINDKVMTKFMLDHGRSTEIQDELIRHKRLRDKNAEGSARRGYSYGKSKLNAKAKANKETMTKALQESLSKAVSKEQFIFLIRQQGIYLNRRSNGSDDLWLRKDGKYRKSISLEYKGTKARTATLLHMDLKEIADQIDKNAQAEHISKVKDQYVPDKDLHKPHQNVRKSVVMRKINLKNVPKNTTVGDNTPNPAFYSLKDLIGKNQAKLAAINKQLENNLLTKEKRQQLLASKQQISSEIGELESTLTVATTKQQEQQMLYEFKQKFVQSDNEWEP
ncbi:hypothetical protein ACWKST_09085 [Limosilactobacillus reuteri]